MSLPLLTTKLCVPILPPDLTPRPLLVQRLEEGRRQGRRLTLVAAPAGFGKTTLLGMWQAAYAHPTVWIGLDASDNDPSRWLSYLISGIQQIHPQIGQTARQLLRAPQMPPAELLGHLINELSAADPLLLVLEDYHLITAPAVHALLQLLLDHGPAQLHIVISTRFDPPLALPRLRTRSQVTEIRERDLRFGAGEIVAFLGRRGLAVSDAGAAALEARTEGWAAGLQLAALAVREQAADTEAFLGAFTGNDRLVVDYLVSEVVQHLPDDVQRFLRQTALLRQFNAALCDALTGRDDSAALLGQLEALNLFLVPLDRQRSWYRYHHLFADALRTRLRPEELPELHRRASRWYAAHSLTDPAVEHALAAGDQRSAAELIGVAADQALHSGEIQTVLRWLAGFPDEVVRAEPALAAAKGWACALSGDPGQAAEYAQAAAERLRSGAPRPEVAGKVQTLLAFLAVLERRNYARVLDHAAAALESLAADQRPWRAMALYSLAEAQEQCGPITETIATLEQARLLGRDLGNMLFSVAVTVALAVALNQHGRRRDAIAVCHDQIARSTDAVGRLSPLAGMVCSQLGTLYYEGGELDQAGEWLGRGLALAEEIGLSGYVLFAAAHQAPLLHAHGRAAEAAALLQRAHRLVVQTGFADSTWPLAVAARLDLLGGDLAAAARWAAGSGLSADDQAIPAQIEQQLVFCRVLLAQGRPAEARRLLARLEQHTRERGLQRWLLSAHNLQALAAERAGDQALARACVLRALAIAAPEGYLRLFVDEDARLIALLPSGTAGAPELVARIRAQAGAPSPAAPDAPVLVEPISAREREVLALIAAGLSNPEIAKELVISLGTVKRHINHLYGKLGVNSRTQAVAKARLLHLLG
ncbi:MAG TPA: LuxR C-terminal-related transcriptional regulator [Roseiflexaceae bacterium]|nr:LuxR C-terminal-related transcriptional regulator [Roseiflexaceae bacterium]